MNTSNLELADSIDYDNTISVSSPVWIDSTSNDDPSTDSTPLSSSVAHDSGAVVMPTDSKESAGNKNSVLHFLQFSVSALSFQPQCSLIEPGVSI